MEIEYRITATKYNVIIQERKVDGNIDIDALEGIARTEAKLMRKMFPEPEYKVTWKRHGYLKEMEIGTDLFDKEHNTHK